MAILDHKWPNSVMFGQTNLSQIQVRNRFGFRIPAVNLDSVKNEFVKSEFVRDYGTVTKKYVINQDFKLKRLRTTGLDDLI
jgi:hypothetical protein